MIELLKAILGIAIVMGAWLAIQSVVRRRLPRTADQDVLEHLAHGCAGCNGSRSCGNAANRVSEETPDKEKHHELV